MIIRRFYTVTFTRRSRAFRSFGFPRLLVSYKDASHAINAVREYWSRARGASLN